MFPQAVNFILNSLCFVEKAGNKFVLYLIVDNFPAFLSTNLKETRLRLLVLVFKKGALRVNSLSTPFKLNYCFDLLRKITN